jgi:hypothetical protein
MKNTEIPEWKTRKSRNRKHGNPGVENTEILE